MRPHTRMFVNFQQQIKSPCIPLPLPFHPLRGGPFCVPFRVRISSSTLTTTNRTTNPLGCHNPTTETKTIIMRQWNGDWDQRGATDYSNDDDDDTIYPSKQEHNHHHKGCAHLMSVILLTEEEIINRSPDNLAKHDKSCRRIRVL